MTICFSKARLRKCLYSTIFLIMLLGIITVLLIKDKSLAVFMVCAPVILYVGMKAIVFFLQIIKRIKIEKDIFLMGNKEEICVYSVDGKKECVECSKIQCLAWDTDRIYIQMKAEKQQVTSKLRRLLRYYVENDSNYITYPLWCESDELKKLCAYLGIEHKKKDMANMDEFVNLCSRYIVILVGTCVFFFWNTISRQNLKMAMLALLVQGIIQFVMHKKNTVPISQDKVTLGLVLRCVMCSAFLAQYIFCACRVEEIIMKRDLLGTCSVTTGVISVVIYLVFWCLFMPQKACGKRITSFWLRKG